MSVKAESELHVWLNEGSGELTDRLPKNQNQNKTLNAWYRVFTDFHHVNTSTMTNFKFLTVKSAQKKKKNPKYLIVCSCKPTGANPKTLQKKPESSPLSYTEFPGS